MNSLNQISFALLSVICVNWKKGTMRLSEILHVTFDRCRMLETDCYREDAIISIECSQEGRGRGIRFILL